MGAVLQIVENDIERDRKVCIKLFASVTGANRELAQWLLDHPRYTGVQVAEWLGCSDTRIKQLRRWAKAGFPGETYRSGTNRSAHDGGSAERNHGSDVALKSQDNSDGDDEGDEDAEFAPPEEIRKNILDSIDRQKAIALAYKKILKCPSLDHEMGAEVSAAIGGLITILQSLQRTLASRRTR